MACFVRTFRRNIYRQHHQIKVDTAFSFLFFLLSPSISVSIHPPKKNVSLWVWALTVPDLEMLCLVPYLTLDHASKASFFQDRSSGPAPTGSSRAGTETFTSITICFFKSPLTSALFDKVTANSRQAACNPCNCGGCLVTTCLINIDDNDWGKKRE
ncbi:uncharacterized protein BKA55DRAFT_571034 [Fusarium redolens]|uniref:Uncharacterized protein n=1 Tax=Fusarium redolens TaxID=48865 RepID=A0A9P9H0Y5_FUSRE|nr:uncharacterized protein BKA55DRAFT_571034 [Fusarium redolens]KAH7249138.1 hypothetical protein BKA55DRAFT_571034 [Fusarium redolens]